MALPAPPSGSTDAPPAPAAPTGTSTVMPAWTAPDEPDDLHDVAYPLHVYNSLTRTKVRRVAAALPRARRGLE